MSSIATGAGACGTDEVRYFACSFAEGAKSVEICHDDNTARYRFGPPDVPELEIVRPVVSVDLVPWPGIGRTIWEEVTFENSGHAYTVYGAIDRAPPANETEDIVVTVSGGIVVRRGTETIAELTCDVGSVDFPWGSGLYDAKEAAGQCFDRGEQIWRNCKD